MRLAKKLILLGLGSLLVGGCSGTREPVREHPQAARPAPSALVEGLDVPGLMALSIDGLGQRLGPHRPLPPGFIDPMLAPLQLRQVQLDSVRFFTYRGLRVVANYDHQSRLVSSLLLLGTDEPALMRRANLVLDAPNYLVLPVFEAQQPTRLLGLRVLPASPELP